MGKRCVRWEALISFRLRRLLWKMLAVKGDGTVSCLPLPAPLPRPSTGRRLTSPEGTARGLCRKPL